MILLYLISKIHFADLIDAATMMPIIIKIRDISSKENGFTTIK